MNEEMRVEAMELCVTACEKHPSSNEVTAIYMYMIVVGYCVHIMDDTCILVRTDTYRFLLFHFSADL